jgi:hypothetical protein
MVYLVILSSLISSANSAELRQCFAAARDSSWWKLGT